MGLTLYKCLVYFCLPFAKALMQSPDFSMNSYFEDEEALDLDDSLSNQNRMLPNGEFRDGAHFLLYTRDSEDAPEYYSIFSKEDSNVFERFSPKRETKIIIHGWRARAPGQFTELLRKAYLSKGDYNLIMVDWSMSGSKHPYYPHAKRNVPFVGMQVAAFIDKLCQSFNISSEKLHIIGHSLGAHVAGVTGRLVSAGSIGRITGLDPAGPLYSKSILSDRLSKYSAKFVDVIHTCGYYLGMNYPVGHVNFYPNLGIPSQPGCGFDFSGSCSHRRAYKYFAESITNPYGFIATSCSNVFYFKRNLCSTMPMLPMGEATPSSARGAYYLKTNSMQPFAVGR